LRECERRSGAHPSPDFVTVGSSGTVYDGEPRFK